MNPNEMPDLAHTPAAAPPPGQMPNFDDPPSQQTAMIATSTVLMVIVLAFVSMRVAAALRTNKTLRAEDCKSAGARVPTCH